MIIDIFVTLILWIVKLVDFIIPSFYLPAFIMDYLKAGFQYASVFNEILPLGAIVFCFLLMVAFHFAVFTIRIFFDVIALVRGSGKIDI